MITTTHRSIRIANQQELQQRQQRKQQKAASRRNSNSGIGSGVDSGCDEYHNSKTNNSPSPRTKHNRKQAKGNCSYVLNPPFKKKKSYFINCEIVFVFSFHLLKKYQICFNSFLVQPIEPFILCL